MRAICGSFGDSAAATRILHLLMIFVVPRDRLAQAIFERRAGSKAKLLAGARGVEAATRLAVRLGRVPDDFAVEAAELGDEFCQLANLNFASRAKVDRLGLIVFFSRERNAFRSIFNIQK